MKENDISLYWIGDQKVLDEYFTLNPVADRMMKPLYNDMAFMTGSEETLDRLVPPDAYEVVFFDEVINPHVEVGTTAYRHMTINGRECTGVWSKADDIHGVVFTLLIKKRVVEDPEIVL